MPEGGVTQVTIKSRDRPGHQAGLFTALQWDDPETADVNLILQDKTVIQTHRIKLGVSPVLKTVLTSLDVRLDSRPHISLQEFETQAVISLLSFIYKGEVVMGQKSRGLTEFMKLCKTLRLNPSVTKERSLAEEGQRDRVSSSEDLDDRESVVSEDEHDDSVSPLVEEQLDTSDVICDDIEQRLDMEEILPCDEPVIPLQPIYTDPQEDSEEESTEHISDYLNSILHNNSTSQDSNSQDKPAEVSEEEDAEYTPFKMPDSFDIPQEYIQEMVPQAARATGVTVPFQTSDEEPETPEIPMLRNNEPPETVETPRDETAGTSPKEHNADSTNLNVDDIFGLNEIVQTYTRKEGSIRQRDHKKTKDKKTHHPKMDRRTLQAKLFGESDSEEEPKKGTVKKKEDFKKEKTLSDSSDSEEESARTPTPTSVRSDLEDKKRRMKKAIKKSEAEDKRAEKAKGKKKTVEHRAIQKATKSSSSAKDHVCNSSCACVKRKVLSDDETWLVPDSTVIYDTTDSDPQPLVLGKKTKPKKVNIGDSSTEDGENDDTDHTELGKKRMAERKVALALRGGGEVLSKLKGRVTVSIQNTPRGIVVDKWQYQAMLDASDSPEAESESDSKKPPIGDSDSDSEVPRGKRVSPIKSMEEERERERERRQERRKKKKLKKLKIVSPKVADFEIEEVEVWTPAMYEKWDKSGRPKKRKHRHDSDSDSKQKSKKPGFNRSMSFGANKATEQQKMLLPRSASSMSTLESLGISHNFGPTLGTSLAKPVSSLPKIPKIKKPENL